MVLRNIWQFILFIFKLLASKINLSSLRYFFICFVCFSIIVVGKKEIENENTKKVFSNNSGNSVVFEHSAPSLLYLKKSLLQHGFSLLDVNRLIKDISEIIGSSWYDQYGKIKIDYQNYSGIKHITKVQIRASGKVIGLNYQNILAKKVESSGNSKRLMIAKGVVSKKFEQLISKNEELPLLLRKRIVQFYKDAQLKIEKGDKFYCLYDTKDCNILGFLISNNREKKMIVSFNSSSGEKFFTSDGKAIIGRKVYFKKPVKGRVSSKFGYRFHPVLKIYKFHQGVDFGAPAGTPVFPAVQSKVIFKGRRGSYGNVVLLKNGNITTFYAHLQSFGDIKLGSWVDCNQIIGKVGSTGMCTGAHLHYEVWVGKKKVNPLNFFQESHAKLQGEELAIFKEKVNRVSQYFN